MRYACAARQFSGDRGKAEERVCSDAVRRYSSMPFGACQKRRYALTGTLRTKAGPYGRTTDKDQRISPLIWISFLAWAFSLCSVSAHGAAGSWHVPGAILKFTIEADPNDPQVPSRLLSGLKAKSGPSAWRNPENGGKWSGTYVQLDGTLYKEAAALSCPETAAYRYEDDFRRFVALVGLNERADPSASVVFEVFADEKKIHASSPVTRYSVPVGIDVRIPSTAKEIKLSTSGSGLAGRRWAYWVNAGFLPKGDNAKVGHVVLPVPGCDPSAHEVAVVTANGVPVPARLLQTEREGKMEVLFYGAYGWSTYYAYVVPKGRHQPLAKEWEPDAGLILETRRADAKHERACDDPGGFVKVWEQAEQTGKSLVTCIHHGHPVHPRLAGLDGRPPTESLALYRYSGFFKADHEGEYVFATASNWGSHLFVDDELVVSWPGKHDYRPGIKGQKQGKVALKPGFHKLEYLNYSPVGTMLTLAAWKPPGGTLGVMTRSDFPSLQGFVPTAVECSPSAEQRVCFDWDVVDDWRLDRDEAGPILMRLRAIRPPGSGSYTWRWTFEDETVATGRAVGRVFLRPGRHRVAVQMLKAGQVVAETAQDVYAGLPTEKIWVDPRDPNAFRRGMSQIDLRKLPVEDAISLYGFATELQERQWRDMAVQALAARLDELTARAEHHTFCLELGQYLCCAQLQQYDQALSIYRKVQSRAAEGSKVRLQAMILVGDTLLRCLGQRESALRILNQARWEPAHDKASVARLGLARAEALLAAGQKEELEQQIRQLCEQTEQKDITRRRIRHAGLLRQAASLARETDPVQLDHAGDMVEAILREDPMSLLAADFNLARLDVYVARGEYRLARYLAERLANLEMTAYDRAQVLLRHVKVLCALGDVATAKQMLEALAQVYPNSPIAAEARAAVIAAATTSRGQ